jgi:hypothetical protein
MAKNSATLTLKLLEAYRESADPQALQAIPNFPGAVRGPIPDRHDRPIECH